MSVSSSAAAVEDIIASYALLSPQNDQVTASGIASLFHSLGYTNIDEDTIRIRLKTLHGKDALNIRDFVALYKSGELSTQELDAGAIHSAINLLLHLPRCSSFIEAANDTPPMTLTTSASELASALDFSASSYLTDHEKKMLINLGVITKQRLGRAKREGNPSTETTAAQRLGFNPKQEVSVVTAANRLAHLASTLDAPPPGSVIVRQSTPFQSITTTPTLGLPTSQSPALPESLSGFVSPSPESKQQTDGGLIRDYNAGIGSLPKRDVSGIRKGASFSGAHGQGHHAPKPRASLLGNLSLSKR